jgi:hypothetical protein
MGEVGSRGVRSSRSSPKLLSLRAPPSLWHGETLPRGRRLRSVADPTAHGDPPVVACRVYPIPRTAAAVHSQPQSAADGRSRRTSLERGLPLQISTFARWEVSRAGRCPARSGRDSNPQPSIRSNVHWVTAGDCGGRCGHKMAAHIPFFEVLSAWTLVATVWRPTEVWHGDGTEQRRSPARYSEPLFRTREFSPGMGPLFSFCSDLGSP